MRHQLIAIVCALSLAACQSMSHLEKSSNEGFLSKYTDLAFVEAADGEEVLRAIDPSLFDYSFKQMVVDPVVLLAEENSELVSTAVLEEIRTYFDQSLRRALSENHQLVNNAQPSTPRFKVALTGVRLNSEGLRVTELLPVGAAIGLVRTATGTRNQEVSVLVEVQIEDSLSRKPLARIIRAGQGDDIRMIWDPQLSLDHVRPLLDSWATLAQEGLLKINTEASP